MSLPKQVKEAQERAERLEAELQPAPEPEQVEVQEAPQPEPTPEPPKQDKADWKAKYHVLQGKYNAEVPRMAQELRELNRQLAEAKQAIEDLKVQKEKAPEPDPMADQIRRLQEDYGPDIVSVIERLVAQQTTELVKPLQSKVEQTESEREAHRQQAEAQRKSLDFAEAVNDLVPDWEAIDKLPEFHNYLAEVGADGRTRQDALMEAANSFDAAGAARIFAAFKRTADYKAPATPAAPAKDRLASQVVPEPAGRDRAPNSGAKVYTRAEISNFYRELALGRMEPERAKNIEKDIEAAMREGRVR